MTDREKAIVMAYTGKVMLVGDKLGIFYKYVQEKLGRSVMTHELAYQEVQDAIEEAAKEDFIAIAKAENGWISVEERLPEITGVAWVVSYWDEGEKEATITVFNNKEAGDACFKAFLGVYDHVQIDEAQVYMTFIVDGVEYGKKRVTKRSPTMEPPKEE